MAAGRPSSDGCLGKGLEEQCGGLKPARLGAEDGIVEVVERSRHGVVSVRGIPCGQCGERGHEETKRPTVPIRGQIGHAFEQC